MPESRQGGFALAGGVVLDERSAAACALASTGGHLLLAWTGGDTRLNLLSSSDGVSFGHKRTFPHRSSRTESSGSASDSMTRTVALPPALTGAAEGLHLGWTGTDRRLNVARLDLGEEGHLVLPERSSHPVALAGWGREIVLAWTGTDRRLNIRRGAGGWFGAPFHLAETSSLPPALVAVGPELLVLWTGTDRQVNLLRWRGDPTPAPPEPLRLAARSSDAPAACPVGDDVVVAWTGSDHHVNLLVLDGGVVPAGHVRTPATTAHAPALATLDGVPFLAWTGRDRRPNVARLVRHP